jgi:hypothetical protein
LIHGEGGKGVGNFLGQFFFFKFLKRFFDFELLMDVALVIEDGLVLSLDNMQIMFLALAYREDALENLEKIGVALGGPRAVGDAGASGTCCRRRYHWRWSWR